MIQEDPFVACWLVVAAVDGAQCQAPDSEPLLLEVRNGFIVDELALFFAFFRISVLDKKERKEGRKVRKGQRRKNENENERKKKQNNGRLTTLHDLDWTGLRQGITKTPFEDEGLGDRRSLGCCRSLG